MNKVIVLFALMLMSCASIRQPTSWLLPVSFFGNDSVMIGKKITEQAVYSKLRLYSTKYLQQEYWVSKSPSPLFNKNFEYYFNEDSILTMVVMPCRSDSNIQPEGNLLRVQKTTKQLFEFCRNTYGNSYRIYDRLSEEDTTQIAKYISILWNIRDYGSVTINMIPVMAMSQEYRRNLVKMNYGTNLIYSSDTLSSIDLSLSYRLSRHWTLQRLGLE